MAFKNLHDRKLPKTSHLMFEFPGKQIITLNIALFESIPPKKKGKTSSSSTITCTDGISRGHSNLVVRVSYRRNIFIMLFC